MKWLTNSEDCRKPEYARSAIGRLRGRPDWLAWTKDKVIGRPKATESYSVEDLEAMGLVGIYVRE